MGANEKHDAAYHGDSQADATPEAEAPKKQELGPVGKWVVGIVALAIVTPFVAILWAWAAEVVRSFG
ncbi:hypothetical protein SEA_KARATE_67 [Microbacterium phage Karate]|nr:hypothetical protein SEA_KARATE_67 [Microbacterium phage Karate]